MLGTRKLLLEGGAGHFGDRSLHNDVYAAIVEWIHQGELRPGDRVSEAAIAQRLGISRAPVREAISRLDHEGLLIRRPRRGAIVPEFSNKDLQDIVSVRQLIEGHAARTACERLTPRDVEELDQLIGVMYSSAQAGRWAETALLNARFHATVVRIADNKLLSKMWQTYHPLAWLLAASPPDKPNKPHDPESLVLRHRGLLDALASGNPDYAEATFRHHVGEATQAKLQMSRLQADHDEVFGERQPSSRPDGAAPKARDRQPVFEGKV